MAPQLLQSNPTANLPLDGATITALPILLQTCLPLPAANLLLDGTTIAAIPIPLQTCR